MKGRKLAYFDLNGVWIALNQEDISRNYNNRSFTHIAFTINDYDLILDKIKGLEVEIAPGRSRDEKDKKSIYFLDPDGHMFEFHTGNLKVRLDYYKEEKEHMVFFED